MIIKIWDIHHGPNESGVKRVLDYITDEAKTQEIDDPSMHNSETNTLRNALEYISEEKKIKNQYISGYLCDPDTAEQEFRLIAEDSMRRHGRTISEDDIACYHIVQSLEDSIKIDPNEMQQIGRELLERIDNGKYMAVIATHCTPVFDEKDGKCHGKQLHNHIIMCAYNSDPDNPDRVKYHDCRESYRELQRINDEIALEHGLPVITRPTKSKNKQQWYEFAIKHTQEYENWKSKIKNDILAAREQNTSWEGFIASMQASGYKIHEGRYTTYEVDAEHRIRDIRLGSEFEKETIKQYFVDKQNILKDLRNDALDSRRFEMKLPQHLLKSAADEADTLVFDVPGTKGERKISIPVAMLEEKKGSYVCRFTGDATFIIDGKQESIEEVMKHFMVKQLPKDDPETTYSQPNRYHPALHTPYHVSLIGSNYRRKSVLQMAMEVTTLALTDSSVLFGEQKMYRQQKHTDFKLQASLDALSLMHKENIREKEDIDKRLMNAGINLGRCKKTTMQLQSSIEQRRQILANIKKFQSIKDAAERILEMDEGSEKEQLKTENAVLLRQYKNLSAYLHTKKVATIEEQTDFETRLNDTVEKFEKKKEELQDRIHEYLKWKKLSDVVKAAEADHFPYDGEPMPNLEEKTPEQDVKEAPSETREEAAQAHEKSTDDFPTPGQENVPEKPVDR